LDHSRLNCIYERYGVQTFRRFFKEIVEEHVETGLAWDRELYFDATKGEANASLDSVRSRSAMEHGLEEHIEGIFPEEVLQTVEGAKTLEITAVGPLVGKVKRSRRQIRSGTIGSPKSHASGGRLFGRATGDWRICGQAPPTRMRRRCNARRKVRAGWDI
jgi:hypothetical protein